MELAEFVLNEILIEHRSVREVAADHGVSKSWLYELLARHRAEGDAGLQARSRRPRSSPTRVLETIEDEIVALRKGLADQGLDCGPHTIAYHLARRRRGKAGRAVPSVATIWRVLSRRGFVVPQPQKRPRSSLRRFAADLPNECWQADTTHWALADGTDVEILNIIDDHSRLLIASRAFPTTKAPDVVETFHLAAAAHGLPASVLTDNGAIFTAAYRKGRCLLETELDTLGVELKHSRPYHPQTCGKIERFHQTLKKWLARQRRARTLAALQDQLDRFADYYNTLRPHRAIDRRTPATAYTARTKAHPHRTGLVIPAHYRIRRDRIDTTGKVTLRYQSQLRHLGIGRRYAGTPVMVLAADQHVRVITDNGELLAEFTLDPTKQYQTQKRPGQAT